ncbi:MAG: hypothetical protein Q8P72_04240, partial [Candidatus Roizmanbacteria bacterium]|nr:hypothetical protein [Candidatus Roizmanbacteria bacterium]
DTIIVILRDPPAGGDRRIHSQQYLITGFFSANWRIRMTLIAYDIVLSKTGTGLYLSKTVNSY